MIIGSKLGWAKLPLPGQVQNCYFTLLFVNDANKRSKTATS